MAHTPKKMLIVGPAWIGDMVMAQSLFKLIKQRNAGVDIDVLAPAWTVSLLNCMPEVHQAINMSVEHGQLGLLARYHLAKQLRAQQYDHAIVLPNSFKSALIPWLAGIPKRTGWRGEFRYVLLNDMRALDKKKLPLMIEQYMALGLLADEALPADYPYPEFHVSQDMQQHALKDLQVELSGRPILAISPGAAYGPSKRWPEHYFAQVANHQLSQGWDVWIFGAATDRPIIDNIMSATDNRCVDFSGKTQLHQTLALLSLTSGVVTNDSGLMHMAAALNIPLIAIYGSTSPAFTPPLSKQATILKLDLACQPCFERVCPLQHFKCMLDLMPDKVIAAMQTWRSA